MTQNNTKNLEPTPSLRVPVLTLFVIALTNRSHFGLRSLLCQNTLSHDHRAGALVGENFRQQCIAIGTADYVRTVNTALQ